MGDLEQLFDLLEKVESSDVGEEISGDCENKIYQALSEYMPDDMSNEIHDIKDELRYIQNGYSSQSSENQKHIDELTHQAVNAICIILADTDIEF